MRGIRVLVFAAIGAMGACGATEPIACTLEARAGINVTVIDAVTGQSAAEGASLTIRDGDWVETISEAFSGSLAGAYEREGTYDLAVARSGYHTWTRTGIEVTADECHVIPVSIEARLEPDLTTGD